jgi:predicted P-loop ATPase
MLKIQHDGTIEIATGRSRRETYWKNKETRWSDLITKLSTTHRTAETYNEYLSSKKQRQDEIKDIGGFVGGYLISGRRKAGSVMHRQLITLDIDAGQPGIWDDFTIMYDCAAAIYSTHKHSPETPRIRLIVPLDRPVMPDEYVAIGRRIAGEMGIEMFDNTGFQPERLMYWPSTSKDGVFEFEYQDGPWLAADKVLAGYRDWKDSSEWPVSERINGQLQRAIKKQGDPLEKPGIVGAFCRTYDIHETITTYLGDVYEECEVEGRYTFKEGSTAAGLITYEDKFAYSHHGTDPVSGKLCNAFDLVRLHLFGLKDEDAREDTPINKMPSYLAMEEHAMKDKKVRKQRGEEKLQDAKVDFADVKDDVGETVAVEDQDLSWMEDLEMDRKGNYYNTIDNLVLILENDPHLKGNLVYDQFEQRPIARRDLPWRKVTTDTRYLTDRDDDNLEHYLEKVYKIGGAKLEVAMGVIFEKHQVHPIREYLNSLKWDGESRLDTLMIDYMGADDSEYTRAVTRKALVAAVARVFEPGIKFDTVLTIIGPQGKGKSTLFQKLGRNWFSDNFHLSMLQGKEGQEQLRGAWIIEIGEMAGMAKADIERIKGFIATRVDRFRQAYGRRVENFQRQCVFFGTTNKSDFLRDQNGNRRFWPVEYGAYDIAKDVFTDLTDYEIGQTWAEALWFYKQDEELFLPAHLQPAAEQSQKEHTEEHPWTGQVQQFVEMKLPENWEKMNRYDRIAYIHHPDELQPIGVQTRDKACIMEIWYEGLNQKGTIDERGAAAIKNIMRGLTGWKEEKRALRFGSYGRSRGGFIRKGYIVETEKNDGTTGGTRSVLTAP